VRVTVESLTTRARTVLDADVVVCATGYRPDDVTTLLGEAATLLRRDAAGRPVVTRDYRWLTESDADAAVYVQGGVTEHSHGITSSLLSNNAVRAGEILDSIRGRTLASGSGRVGVTGSDGAEMRAVVGVELAGASEGNELRHVG